MDNEPSVDDIIDNLICEVIASRRTYPELILSAIKDLDAKKTLNKDNILRKYHEQKFPSKTKNGSSFSNHHNSLRKSIWLESNDSFIADAVELKRSVENARAFEDFLTKNRMES